MVREVYPSLVTRKSLRLVFAALFLFVLLAEFSSHVLAHTHSQHIDERSISAHDGRHHDPCKHLMPCCDKGRSDEQAINAGHQLVSISVLDTLQVPLVIDVDSDPQIPLSSANELRRPPRLPFHPPKLS